MEPRTSCPHCGSNYGLPWPSGPANAILVKAFAIEPKDEEELGLMATMVAVAVETLLEWTLQGILERFTHGAPLPTRPAEYLIDADWTVERRLHMIKTIAEIDYAGVAKQVGEREFPSDWKELRERRNRFVHRGDSWTLDPPPELHLLLISRAALKVFAELNNFVWRQKYEEGTLSREDLSRELAEQGMMTEDTAGETRTPLEPPRFNLLAILPKLPEDRRVEVLVNYAAYLKKRDPTRFQHWHLTLPVEHRAMLPDDLG